MTPIVADAAGIVLNVMRDLSNATAKAEVHALTQLARIWRDLLRHVDGNVKAAHELWLAVSTEVQAKVPPERLATTRTRLSRFHSACLRQPDAAADWAARGYRASGITVWAILKPSAGESEQGGNQAVRDRPMPTGVPTPLTESGWSTPETCRREAIRLIARRGPEAAIALALAILEVAKPGEQVKPAA